MGACGDLPLALCLCPAEEGSSPLRTVTEGLGLDVGAALLHSSFRLLQSVFGPVSSRLHQFLHLSGVRGTRVNVAEEQDPTGNVLTEQHQNLG